MRASKLAITIVLGLGTSVVALITAAEGREPLDGFERHVGADGSFHFDPANALEGLVHIGSWFVPEGDAAGFHGVYTQRAALEGYRKTGAFPDGALLIKELRGHTRGNYTTGSNVASATGTTRWFVMVKDERGRFPSHPLWGEGWGWALFESEAPTENAADDFRKDCLACHAPAAATDWVYVQGYPLLRE